MARARNQDGLASADGESGEGVRRKRKVAVSRFEPRAVVFDFDGVVVNSEPLHFHAMYVTLKGEGIEITEDEYFSELIGFDDRGAFRRIFELRGRALDAKNLLRVMAAKSLRMREVIEGRKYKALPGVSELIRALWRQYPLAICSGALREEIEAMLEGIGLRDCFPVITAAEDVTVGKPDPMGYVQTIAMMSKRLAPLADGRAAPPLRADECLIIEDAPTVIRNVKAVGFRTLGVSGSYPLEALGEADRAVTRLSIEQVKRAFPKLRLGA